MAERTWKCQRQIKGVRCAAENPKRRQICQTCGGRRPVTKRAAHHHVMDVFPYKTWVLFFGETCGICGNPPLPGKKLHRDHDHRVKPGDPTLGMRGLLCYHCNLQLHFSITLERAEKQVEYLRGASALSDR